MTANKQMSEVSGQRSVVRAQAQRVRVSPFRSRDCGTVSPFRRSKSFTLLELLIVVGIIALLLVLMAPASRTSKAEPTSRAPLPITRRARHSPHLRKGKQYLHLGRLYGFLTLEQQTTGQVQMAIVASKDGTNLWSANNALSGCQP